MPRVRHHKSYSEKERSKILEDDIDKSCSSNLDKKDFTLETADIGGFTLMFRDPEKELKWHMTHQMRHVGITQRYLFACALFQILFFCKSFYVALLMMMDSNLELDRERYN